MANKNKGKDEVMKMSRLADASALSVSTIKFYISQGLLPRPKKDKPNVAFYDQAFLRRLLIVKKMRAEGLSIKSIRSILDKYPFDRVSEWESFKQEAKKKSLYDLAEEERLATLTDEERRTEAILDAAFHVFSDKGYHSATVDDIAQEAGVSKGTCYQYFEGKEDIFIATMDLTLEKLIAEANASAEGAEGALQRLGMKGLSFLGKYRDIQFMFIGVFSEVLGGNEHMRKKAAEIYDKVAVFLEEDLKAGIEEGVFREMDTRNVAYALLGIAEVVGKRSLIEDDFDVVGFFVNLLDFMQHGVAKRG